MNIATNYETFSDAWATSLYDLLSSSQRSSPRGMQTNEIRWSQITVDNPLSFPVMNPARNFRDVIGVLEALSLVGQVSVPETFTSRIAKFGEFMDDGIFHGAYGARAHGALGDVVSLLERDLDSRQAVITVFDSKRDLDRVKRDIPCTIALHFRQADGYLELNTTMRSNDAWLGTPYDFTQFAVAQLSVAQALNLMPGEYVHSAGSLHLYERDFAQAAKCSAHTEYNDTSMNFPLWADADSIGSISERARNLLLSPKTFIDKTMFETWARDLLL